MIFRTNNKVACVVDTTTNNHHVLIDEKQRPEIIVNSTTTSSNNKKTKHISWSSSEPQINVYQHPDDDEAAAAEAAETDNSLPQYSPWYSQGDYDVFYQECLLTTMLVKKFGRIPSQARDKVTTRGLGHMISEERAEARRVRRADAWEVVLGEQYYQREFMRENKIDRYSNETLHYNAECIARMYKEVSSVCETESHLQALQDAKQAKQVHKTK